MTDARRPLPDSADLDRRAALAALAALGLTGLAAVAAGASQPDGRPSTPPAPPALRHPSLTPEQLGWDPQKRQYVLPPLPYPADALEPHIDAQTMQIHHDKHHQGYVTGLNRALEQLDAIRRGQGDPSLIKFWSNELAFNGSGHVNHSLFWITMAPPGAGGGGRPQGELADAIDRDFGGFEPFADHFKNAAKQVEGSGWGWLVYHPVADKLMVLQGEKQQDHTIWGVIPLLGVDVWEHAYYLKYQNRRADYVDAFMNVINWPRVAEIYQHARRLHIAAGGEDTGREGGAGDRR